MNPFEGKGTAYTCNHIVLCRMLCVICKTFLDV